MAEFLTFRLYAPLQSWGDVSPGENRTTWTGPSRSALAGLIGAALGLRREDPELSALHLGLRFAVRHEGRKVRQLVDFHTAQTPHGIGFRINRGTELSEVKAGNGGTILSDRYYLQDAVFAVAAWSVSGISLDRLRRALSCPAFMLYLGRKSCPLALPLGAVIIDSETAAAALDAYPVTWEPAVDLLEPPGANVTATSDVDEKAGFKAEQIRYRRDVCVDPILRLFQERQELVATVQMPGAC